MTSPNAIRELDHRSADGIEVWLLWAPADDRVIVSVHDARTGEAFEIEVEPHETAMEVFRHPFAFAAHRGIEPRVSALVAS
jgi:hypothetical protein